MQFNRYDYTDISATASATTYAPIGEGAAEHHVMVQLANPRLPYAQQLACLIEAGQRACAALEQQRSRKAAAVLKRYFLSDASNQAHLLPKGEKCAVSVVEQAPLNGTKAALWIYLVEDAAIERRRATTIASRSAYRHIWRASMAAPDLSSEVATIALLGDYSTQLRNMGCSLADNCLRTWLFVHDVDVNYKGVVSGRNEVFRCAGLTPETHFIASTGIGGRHPNPTVTVEMDTYAVSGIAPEQVRYLHAPTHLNPTYEYGVAFERGTSIDYGDRRHVLISGTASIDNKGKVLHEGDIVKQTARMIENVEALLADAEATWADVAQAIVYLRDPSDYTVVSELLAQRFPTLPYVIVLAPVCRQGWLIEIECIAITPHTSPFPAL